MVASLAVGLGGLVRGDAALACPDVPLCHGRLVPPLDLPTAAMLAHRGLGLALAVAALAAGVALVRSGRLGQAVALGAAILLQIGLGSEVVTSLLEPTLVVAHRTFAFALLALIAGINASAWGAPNPVPARAVDRALSLGAVALVAAGVVFAGPHAVPIDALRAVAVVLSVTYAYDIARRPSESGSAAVTVGEHAC